MQNDDKDTGNGENRRIPGVGTLLTHGGRNPQDQFGFVNTPVYRGSTVLFKTLDDLESRQQRFYYGRAGTPTTESVEEIVTTLEGAHATQLVPSGLAAISIALLSCVEAGDEVLITDSAYEPTRSFADTFLARMGVTARYYDPRIGAGIAELMSEQTKVVFCESPGSGTFEVQDLPAIAAAAHEHGARVIIDNSWASPLYHRPLLLGADIVVHAGTKMFVGHSDAFAGTISANEATWPAIAKTRALLGYFTSGDEAFLVARGLRTLEIRMAEHQARALEIARWLEDQNEVEEVRHPALPIHPDHHIWQRDFSGSGSLFSFLLKPAPRASVAAFIDHLRLFSVGYSWGGFESLCLPVKPQSCRTAVPWTSNCNLFRLHIGFEDVADLKADLADAIARYAAAR